MPPDTSYFSVPLWLVAAAAPSPESHHLSQVKVGTGTKFKVSEDME